MTKKCSSLRQNARNGIRGEWYRKGILQFNLKVFNNSIISFNIPKLNNSTEIN
jgi:hypothetical protein